MSEKPRLQLWPDPPPGVTYGPTPKQKLLFIEELPEPTPDMSEEDLAYCRPHKHPLDIVLYIGAGRCFAQGTKVLMASGKFKTIEKIKVGDKVLGWDGKPKRVMELHKGEELLYKVTPSKGKSFLCNENHTLSLMTSGLRVKSFGSGNQKKSYFSSGDVVNMTLRDYLSIKNSTKKASYKLYKNDHELTFHNRRKILPVDPYFFGLWLGDGTSKEIAISNTDQVILNYVRKQVEGKSHLRIREDGSENCPTLVITKGNSRKYSNEIYDAFKKLKVLNNKHIPQELKTASVEDRYQLLAGLIDTDGYLANNSYYEITQKNKRLAEDIAFVARSLGFVVNINKVTKSCKYKGEVKKGLYYRLNICGNIENIPVKLERKRPTFRGRIHRQNPFIVSFTVEPRRIEKYYGFTLEGNDSRFFHEDFTVLHNSGKTRASSVRVLKYLLDNPKAYAIVGAVDFKFVKKTVIDEIWEPWFSINEPWDHVRLDNRLIIKKPVQTDQTVYFANGSKAEFVYMSKEGKLKGRNASIVLIEEADQLNHEGAFEELMARLSNSSSPYRQLILNTNPDKARKGWINRKFKLYQQDKKYKGKKELAIPPCQCQYCPKCNDPKNFLGKFVFVDAEGNPSTSKGSTCSNPKCAFIELTKVIVPGQAPIMGEPFQKDNDCPGEQVYYRIIETATRDNPHITSDYAASAASGMSEKTAAGMIYGEINQDHEGEVYLAFADENINYDEIELDYSKDINWCLDQNDDPHCSLICQETETDSSIRVDVIDEIFEWDYLVEEACKKFCQKYKDFKQTQNFVKVWTDPAALYGTSKKKLTFYQKVITYLRSPTNDEGDIMKLPNGELDWSRGTAFKVKGMMKKDPRSYKDKNRERLIVYVSEKIHAINDMLCNAEKERRVFINFRCQRLIASLEGVKFKPGSNDTINTNIDVLAKKHQEDQGLPTTHPSDALGYYLAKRFPMLKEKSGTLGVGNRNASSIYKDGKVYNKSRLDAEDLEESDEEKAESDELRAARKKRKLKRVPTAYKSKENFLKATGLRLRNF